jgi:M6 family metalloprotease-like protein
MPRRARAVGAGVLLAAVLGWQLAEGVPAYPYCKRSELAGGCGLRPCLFERGDERLHWVETSEGYTLCRGAGGALVFATGPKADGPGLACSSVAYNCSSRSPPASLVASSTGFGALSVGGAAWPRHVRPSPEEVDFAGDATAGRGLAAARPADMPRQLTVVERVRAARAAGRSLAAAGPVRVHAVVLLLKWKDHNASSLFPASAYDALVNKAGGDPQYAPSGSLQDVYAANLYGKITFSTPVVGWIESNYTEQQVSNKCDLLNTCGRQLKDAIVEALLYVQSTGLLDLRSLDADGDRVIDMVSVIHSGHGREFAAVVRSNGDNYGIHSHQGRVDRALPGGLPWAGLYNVNPGLWAEIGSPVREIGRIGVLAHESMHVLGLPDLYDMDYSSLGLGDWCLMAGGMWVGDQQYPSSLSAWCKEQLGVVAPVELFAQGRVEVQSQASAAGSVAKILLNAPRCANCSDEYLLVENRQRAGYDLYLPGGMPGLLVYHVDPNVKTGNDAESFPGNSTWPVQAHYMVSLIQADGRFELEKGVNFGDAGDVFQAANASALGDGAAPGLTSYRSLALDKCSGVRLSGISMATGAAGATGAMQFNLTFTTTNCSGAVVPGSRATPVPTAPIAPPPTAAPGWFCPAEYYGALDGCDCNCGPARDPDCNNASQTLFCDGDEAPNSICTAAGYCVGPTASPSAPTSTAPTARPTGASGMPSASETASPTTSGPSATGPGSAGGEQTGSSGALATAISAGLGLLLGAAAVALLLRRRRQIAASALEPNKQAGSQLAPLDPGADL